MNGQADRLRRSLQRGRGHKADQAPQVEYVKEGVDSSYMSRTVNRTALAPDIVVAILYRHRRPM